MFALYGGLCYAIIVGGLFRSVRLVLMFLPLALLTGLFFGLSYALLIRWDKLVGVLAHRPLVKVIFFLSPSMILVFFMWLLPMVMPAQVFRNVPDEIRSKIVARIIPKYKAGDRIDPLKEPCPAI
ncbi:hypothetical protein [Hydrobacter penzbergensis]|uniref:hypothetical protein n=1 Tax=Hydrobacter penzbergensis TaxID=1235997 RepID=UPI000B8956B8|nr:hypothetical protein [Hydrobacter penzbergensis]